MDESGARRIRRDDVVAAQGVYYAITGTWALLHIKSFEAVTGPKTDRWLVKMVGALVLVSGSVMAATGFRKRDTPEVHALAAASCVAFAAIDVVYALKRRISPVYLLDAAAELALLGALASRRR